MIKLWKSLPEWAQWLLYLPCTIIIPSAAGMMVSLVPVLNGASKMSLAVVVPLATVVATVVFYWCAFYLAPRAKKATAGILFFIFMLLWIMTALRLVIGWNMEYFEVSFPSVMELVQALIGITLGSYLFIGAFRRSNEMEL